MICPRISGKGCQIESMRLANQFANLLKGRMTESEKVRPRRRRTRQEVERLVREFVASGLSRGEFCRIRRMTLGTLQRGLNREGIKSGDVQAAGKRLLRVKITGWSGTGDRHVQAEWRWYWPMTGASSSARILKATQLLRQSLCTLGDSVNGRAEVLQLCYSIVFAFVGYGGSSPITQNSARRARRRRSFICVKPCHLVPKKRKSKTCSV
jgi:hypothetical protein